MYTALKEHDFSCSENRDNILAKNKANIVPTEKAWNRVLTKDAKILR